MERGRGEEKSYERRLREQRRIYRRVRGGRN